MEDKMSTANVQPPPQQQFPPPPPQQFPPQQRQQFPPQQFPPQQFPPQQRPQLRINTRSALTAIWVIVGLSGIIGIVLTTMALIGHPQSGSAAEQLTYSWPFALVFFGVTLLVALAVQARNERSSS
jgi:hypothetical protein